MSGGIPTGNLPQILGPWPIGEYPRLIRDPGCCIRGNSRHHVASPAFLASLVGTLPSILLQGGCPLVGIPFRMTVRGSCHSKLINIFVLSYISMILQASSKSAHIKISEIKYEKNTSICKTLNAVDPAKRGLARMRIELAALNFCPEPERALPAHRAG